MSHEKFSQILNNEKKRIREFYPSKNVVLVVVEIIRALDYIMFLLKHDIAITQKDWLIEKYRFGWGLAFSIFYEDYDHEDEISSALFDPETRKWLDGIIQHAGMVQVSSQFLLYCKADLMELTQPSDHNFIFKYKIDDPIEQYEKRSLNYYFDTINSIYEARVSKLQDRLPLMREQLKEIVNTHNGTFISYIATEEVDNFYSEFGRLYLRTTQIIDDFDEADVFGGISYKQYLDFAEDLIMAAMMHRDCCMALAEKMNHKVHLRDILTYTFSKNLFLKNYSESRGLPEETVSQIASCFTINRANFGDHLNYPGAPCPPFIELSDNLLMRSMHGCLDMPVFFLNRALKRKYSKDYFNAVNNRELRFRNQLYSLFPEKIQKIHKNIIIQIDQQSTDIDAIIFDPFRKILGLFQLKWQDTFSTSMRERFSRISNLIPKSVEWIDKVDNWLNVNTTKEILDKLGINDNEYIINNIYVFVISRNHMHFSNQIMDKRAIWASWYQVIEACAKVKDPLQANPILEFVAKLQFFSPTNRKSTENSRPIEAFNYKISKYNVVIQPFADNFN